MNSFHALFSSALPARLRLIFSLGGLLTLVLCLATVFYLDGVSRQVSGLAGAVSESAAPAAELMRLMEGVALAIGQYTRTRSEPERVAAMEEFKRVRQRMRELRVALAANPQARPMDQLIRSAQVELLLWQRLFEETATWYVRSERSTRGLAAQTSLLATICTQLATDDGTLIEGERAPEHRKVLATGLGLLSEIQNNVLFASSLQNPDYVDRALEKQERLAKDLAGLLAATAPSTVRDFLDDVAGRMKDLGDELKNQQTSLTERNRAQAEMTETGRVILSRLEPVVRQIMQETVTAANHANRRLEKTVLGLGGAAVLLPLVGLCTGHLFSRQVGRRLRPLMHRLGTAVALIGRETRRAEVDGEALALAAREQTSALQASSATARQVADSAATCRAQAGVMTRLAEKASIHADHGGQSIAALTAAMTDIATSAQQVQQVIDSIEGIAFETNILALNASIEAARAGEAGRGFAIVAEEVRRLAGRSAQAARHTVELVSASQQANQRGGEAAHQVTHGFQSIIQVVGELRGVLAQTDKTAETQAQTAASMVAALGQLEARTIEASRRMERQARFATALNSQAQHLQTEAAALEDFTGRSAHGPAETEETAPLLPETRREEILQQV